MGLDSAAWNGTFCGIRVIVSPHLSRGLMKSKREHIRRPGQSEAYHRRIQKKWDKRFGRSMEEQVLLMQEHGVPYLMMAPATAERLLRQADKLSQSGGLSRVSTATAKPPTAQNHAAFAQAGHGPMGLRPWWSIMEGKA